jgi:hypothetical protein
MTRILLLAIIAVLASCSFDDGDGETVRAEQTTTAEVTTDAEPPEQPGLGEDPDDVTSPLDLESVSAVRTGDLLAVSLTTYEEWEDEVLSAPRLGRPGPNRLVIAYDVNLDGKRDYIGEIVFAEGALSLVIEGLGQAFEPVPVERPDNSTAQFVHPVDVLFLPTEGSDEDIQVAVTSVFGETNDSVGPVAVATQ